LVVRNEEGAYTLTEAGVEALDAFDTLCVAVEQSVEKATFLNQIGELSVDLPFDALDTAELVPVTESDPHAVVGRTAEVIEARGDTISVFRGLTPVFSPYMFKMFRDLADRNTTMEAIFDATAFDEARQPQNFPYFIGPLVHPNVSLRLYSERVPFGIGLFDDLLMFVGYLDPVKHEVAIITDDERLVAWAERLFMRYWDESRSPSDRLRQRVAGYLGDRSVS
jgi:predicted transcriptional regulator